MALMIMPLFVQADVTNSTVTSIVSNSGNIITGIKSLGLKWFANLINILNLLFVLIGAGYIIVKTTPTNKDDVWYGKYILKPWRFIGNILTWFGINVPDAKKKKK
jgi:hypothetical protein